MKIIRDIEADEDVSEMDLREFYERTGNNGVELCMNFALFVNGPRKVKFCKEFAKSFRRKPPVQRTHWGNFVV